MPRSFQSRTRSLVLSSQLHINASMRRICKMMEINNRRKRRGFPGFKVDSFVRTQHKLINVQKKLQKLQNIINAYNF